MFTMFSVGAARASALKLTNFIREPVACQTLRCKSKSKGTTKWDVSARAAGIPCKLTIKEVPCFDINKVSIEVGTPCDSRMIRSFLYAHHWPREPTVIGLWMDLRSPSLDILTDKYSNFGDRFIAFEHIPRTNETKVVGLLVANKIHSWAAEELESWGHYTKNTSERNRMFFLAHCLKSPDLFHKHHVDCIYDIEVVCTARDVARFGVAKLLLRHAIAHAQLSHYSLVHVVSTNHYLHRVCENAGMKMVWSMKYTDYVDHNGRLLFYPRRPHTSACVYIKLFNLKKGLEEPNMPPFYY